MYPEKQKNESKTAMRKAKDRRHFERYQAVFLYLDGYGVTEISRIIGRRLQTVRGYVNAYQQSDFKDWLLATRQENPNGYRMHSKLPLLKSSLQNSRQKWIFLRMPTGR